MGNRLSDCIGGDTPLQLHMDIMKFIYIHIKRDVFEYYQNLQKYFAAVRTIKDQAKEAFDIINNLEICLFNESIPNGK